MWDGSLDREAAFYEKIADTKPLAAKLHLLWDFAQNIGFSDIYYCKLQDPLSPSPYNKANVQEYRFGDEAWHSLYEGEQYASQDWALERATWDRQSFRLDQPPNHLTEKQEEFVRHARDYNRQNGFCFPLMDRAGLNGGFSATGCDRAPSQAQVMQVTSALQLTELTITAQKKSQTCAAYGLNERELSDLQMLAAGRTMADIAHLTGKSAQWIRLSFITIRSKLGVSTNPQLIHRAMTLGLL